MESRGPLTPLDTLTGDGGRLALRDGTILIMAQPRPLSPQENVALDDWVRSGGRVLLFADPMLTAHTDFALGDRRRPQDIVLLSPILRRWGLDLRFDDRQDSSERDAVAFGAAMPVDLAGSFAVVGGDCRIDAGGLGALCDVGRGRVLAIADSAVLEGGEGDEAGRTAALLRLLKVLAEA